MKSLARALITAVAFLELSSDEVVDADAAVEVLEQIGQDLSRCSDDEKAALKKILSRLHAEEQLNESRPEVLEFFETFLASFGLEDES
jgi:hypothetical protein